MTNTEADGNSVTKIHQSRITSLKYARSDGPPCVHVCVCAPALGHAPHVWSAGQPVKFLRDNSDAPLSYYGAGESDAFWYRERNEADAVNVGALNIIRIQRQARTACGWIRLQAARNGPSEVVHGTFGSCLASFSVNACGHRDVRMQSGAASGSSTNAVRRGWSGHGLDDAYFMLWRTVCSMHRPSVSKPCVAMPLQIERDLVQTIREFEAAVNRGRHYITWKATRASFSSIRTNEKWMLCGSTVAGRWRQYSLSPRGSMAERQTPLGGWRWLSNCDIQP